VTPRQSDSPLHVLIIHRRDATEGYAAYLTSEGFRASEASDSDDGVAKALELMPDFIVLDFDLDGVGNTVQQIDVVPDEPGPGNPHGNAFSARATTLTTEKQARANLNLETMRTWRIINSNSQNAVGERPMHGRARSRDRELGVNGLGHRQIALSAELERCELDLPLVDELLAGAELEGTKVEGGHASQRSNAPGGPSRGR